MESHKISKSVKYTLFILAITIIITLVSILFIYEQLCKINVILTIYNQELEDVKEQLDIEVVYELNTETTISNKRQLIESMDANIVDSKRVIEPEPTPAKIIKETTKPTKEPKPTQIASRSKSNNRTKTFTATAYDLSIQSCGKSIGSKGYGITANGTNLSNKSREEAMTIAVDRKVIKLGSKVRITFPSPYTHFNGVYTANDTGGAIKGKMVDIFMGDFRDNKTHQSVWDFGVRWVQVEVLK